MECVNCNAAEGRERSLLIEDGDREITIVLCEECYRAFLEEEWIEPGE